MLLMASASTCAIGIFLLYKIPQCTWLNILVSCLQVVVLVLLLLYKHLVDAELRNYQQQRITTPARCHC